ncbi:MAG: hypothetical protein A2W31_09425 [Planctomycetes bacterium RBG_16_64_10]|nr:MAG: hypothetical protein A2W31_09425 [Planctomycetes bacterium RBG_16_64_10]
MRKLCGFAAVAAVAVALVVAAGTVWADSLVLDRIGLTYTGVGGEFNIKPLNGPALNFVSASPPALDGSSFQSFCVERGELVTPGSTYDYVINTGAVNGGGGAIGNFDALDARTAYLFTEFSVGTLAGYTYTPGAARQASAGALQNAIWYIEQELAVLPAGLATTFYNAAVAAAWTGIGNVRVLNLYASGGTAVKQDQLIMIPTPAAVFMGLPMLGLLGAFRIVRRRT